MAVKIKYAIRFRWQPVNGRELVGKGNRVHAVWPILYESREQAEGMVREHKDVFINLRGRRKLSCCVDPVYLPA